MGRDCYTKRTNALSFAQQCDEVGWQLRHLRESIIRAMACEQKGIYSRGYSALKRMQQTPALRQGDVSEDVGYTPANVHSTAVIRERLGGCDQYPSRGS